MKYDWAGMPEFIQEKKEPYKKEKITFLDGSYIFVRFETEEDHKTLKFRCLKLGFCEITKQRSLLASVTAQKITEKTKSIWFPFKSHWGGIKKKYVTAERVHPKYPVYIVSKGRAENGLTTKALNKMNVDHYLVVEASEHVDYILKSNSNATVIILPQSYLDEYDTCDDLGESRSKGPGAARNFCKQHSIDNGFKKHWVMDDNLDAFHYLNKNEKYEVETGATLLAAEDFVDRYSNVPVSGLNYYSFCKKTDAVPPLVMNTRIYSCLLIDNSFDYPWRGRYNEDTDLSLRVLKDGLCTIQFNAFLCGKVTTQRMKGGNTKEFYAGEGTLPKSQMIADLHPDVASVVWRFNRHHHHVNYKPFKENALKLKSNKEFKGVNSYGLVMVDK
jgi:hypothetical protein